MLKTRQPVHLTIALCVTYAVVRMIFSCGGNDYLMASLHRLCKSWEESVQVSSIPLSSTLIVPFLLFGAVRANATSPLTV